MSSLKGKVIAITGAANGIALATSHLLASHSAILCLADIDSAALSRAADAITSSFPSQSTTPTSFSPAQPDPTVRTHTLDVSSASAVTQWIKGIVDEFGRLDGAVNFAAIQDINGMAMIEDMEDEHWEKIMRINLKGVFNCLRPQLHHMKHQSPLGGSIVNATSVQARFALPENAAYVSAKHAVIGLTKTAAKEAGSSGVRVNVVAPGCIDTRMTDEMESRMGALDHKGIIALQRKGTAGEVAGAIVWLLGEESSYVTGSVVEVDGGFAI